MTSSHSRRDLLLASPIGDALNSIAEQDSGQAMVTMGRKAMACQFQLTAPTGDPLAVSACNDALDLIDDLEDLMTVYRTKSELSRVNLLASAMPVPVDPILFRALQMSLEIHCATRGAFDIATGSLIKCWGFMHGPRRVPETGELRAALESSGSRFVKLNRANHSVRFIAHGVQINLGAIGKGFALDMAVELLRARGVGCALLHGGQSSVSAIGTPPGQPWNVGITHPIHKDERIATISLRDCSLGTSGAAIQFFESEGRRFGHILDPRTGWPAASRACVSVVAATAAEADALSTAFFVMGTNRTREFIDQRADLGAVVVTPAGSSSSVRVEVLGRAQGLVSVV